MIKYVCDLCKEDIDPKDLEVITVPVYEDIYALHNGIKIAKLSTNAVNTKLEVCPKCFIAIASFIDQMDI